MDANKEAHLSACIHDYHVYNVICSATVAEELQCIKKLGMRRTDMQSPSYELQMCSSILTSKIYRIDTSGAWNIT